MTQLLRKCTARFSETAIDGEVVVMELERGDFFSLTGTAAAAWQRIDGTRTRAALIADLAADHDLAPADVAADVDAFLDQLRAAGLIEPN